MSFTRVVVVVVVVEQLLSEHLKDGLGDATS